MISATYPVAILGGSVADVVDEELMEVVDAVQIIIVT